MAFPEVGRVIYDKNPLDEVICQLRFPSILKIETEIPADFQEQIREQYPFYKTKSIGKMPAGVPDDLAKAVAIDFPLFPSGKAHEFISRDENWKISLTKTFVALSCAKYQRWEEFKDHLAIALGALEEIYKPTFYTRLGLRYRDVIRRSALSLEKVRWSDLLQPWIAGNLAKSEIADDIEESAGELLIRLPEERGKVRLRHGLASDDATHERCYLIDADYFDESQTERQYALEKLDYLNRQSRYLFRWCITDTLHTAMGPHHIEPK